MFTTMRLCYTIRALLWWSSTAASELADRPALAYIPIIYALHAALLLLGARLSWHAALKVVHWATAVSHITDVQRRVAASIEQRATSSDEVQLIEALEDEGVISDEVHNMCAEDAYKEINMRSAKQFYKVWIAAVRLEFPLRSDRPSDRACMTKWLAQRMRATGMRITHIEDAVPRIVSMAINPSRAEVEAAEMGREADKWRHAHSSGWRWLLFGAGAPDAGRTKWE